MIESPECLENMPAHEGSRDYYLEGLALGREGRHEEAILAFSEVLSVDPGNSRAWVGKGFNLGKLGRYGEEIECCDKAISLDPKSVDAWNYKGFAYGMLGRFLDKVECCDRALEIDPENATAWNNKGVALGMLGKYEAEIRCCDRAIEIRPRYLSAWVNEQADDEQQRSVGAKPCEEARHVRATPVQAGLKPSGLRLPVFHLGRDAHVALERRGDSGKPPEEYAYRRHTRLPGSD